MRGIPFYLAVAAAVSLASQPAWAQDTKFKLFGGVSYISPLSDEDVDFGSVKDSVEASSELGWTAGVEFRFGKLVGLEIDYVNATHDVELGGDKIADIDFAPLSASLNFHLIHTKLVDFYIAPTATYVMWGDLELESGLSFSSSDIGVDNEFAYGASIGLDIGLGDHFAILGGLRWLDADIDGDDFDDVGVDPLLARLGAAFRF